MNIRDLMLTYLYFYNLEKVNLGLKKNIRDLMLSYLFVSRISKLFPGLSIDNFLFLFQDFNFQLFQTSISGMQSLKNILFLLC